MNALSKMSPDDKVAGVPGQANSQPSFRNRPELVQGGHIALSN